MLHIIIIGGHIGRLYIIITGGYIGRLLIIVRDHS